jgi:histidinol-phosphatase
VPDWSAELALALELADRADAITTARFAAADLVVESKPDLTPVTDADRAVEEALRRRLARERPGDGVVGEELGGGSEGGSHRWVIDPIDGTKNFVRGAPVWATLIALQVDGVSRVGVVSAPALARRWWAAEGSGAFTGSDRRNARACTVSKVQSLEDAFFSYSSLGGWGERLPALLGLAQRVWRTRAFGDFWSHMLVAEGAVDLSCEPEVELWDLAALQPIVEQAGGCFTDLSGLARADGGSVLCSNGRLHDDALAALAGEPRS